MRLIIALAGSGDVTEKNASTLLNDFIDKRETVLFVPNYITQEQEGLRTVIEWWGPDYCKIRKGKMLSKFDELEGEYAFIVLGTEGLEDMIGQAQRAGIPVLDLCKGLFQITGALDGVESNAEALSEEPEADDPQDESDLVRIDPGAMNVVNPEGYATRAELDEAVRKIMTVIKVFENKYLNGVLMQGTVEVIKPPDKEELIDLPSEATISTPNYYKSKTGKLRPMGRSKARPGETPVHLTQEEINALG